MGEYRWKANEIGRLEFEFLKNVMINYFKKYFNEFFNFQNSIFIESLKISKFI